MAFTIFTADQQDLLVYGRNPDNPKQYRYKSGWATLTEEETVIAVKGKAPVTRTMAFTVHGPVIYQDRTRLYAVRSAASEPGTAPYLGQLALLNAKSVDAYRAGLAAWGAPGEHHVFADANGNIAWQSAAKVPIRSGHDGLLPASGEGDHEWRGFHPLTALPQEENPERGWVVSANHRPKLADYPYAERALSYEWVGDSRGAADCRNAGGGVRSFCRVICCFADRSCLALCARPGGVAGRADANRRQLQKRCKRAWPVGMGGWPPVRPRQRCFRSGTTPA